MRTCREKPKSCPGRRLNSFALKSALHQRTRSDGTGSASKLGSTHAYVSNDASECAVRGPAQRLHVKPSFLQLLGTESGFSQLGGVAPSFLEFGWPEDGHKVLELTNDGGGAEAFESWWNRQGQIKGRKRENSGQHAKQRRMRSEDSRQQ